MQRLGFLGLSCSLGLFKHNTTMPGILREGLFVILFFEEVT